MQIKAVKGVKDILPNDTYKWSLVESLAKETFALFGFSEIKTPIIEKTELFVRSIGEETDIVSKEMYTFPDRGGVNITLRPEGTASVVRAYVENKLYTQSNITKLYYFGPMFRRERPQKGRYRQFYQIGAESFGSDSPVMDADVVYMLFKFLKALKIDNIEIHINSLGCKNCRDTYRDKLKSFFESNLKNLCEDCNRRFVNNPLRILDCKVKACSTLVDGAPSSTEYICDECSTHHETFKGHLRSSSVDFIENKRLVRGLDYYSKTAFEVIVKTLGAQNAVAGGGRYDSLVEKFGGPKTPAVGFAIGVERLVSLIDFEKIYKPEGKKCYLVAIGDNVFSKSYDICNKLRDEGLPIDMSYEKTSLKSQMKKANKLSVDYSIIIGDDELSKNSANVKDMLEGSQETVLIGNVCEYINQKQEVKSKAE